jgi:hypothetical protein
MTSVRDRTGDRVRLRPLTRYVGLITGDHSFNTTEDLEAHGERAQDAYPDRQEHLGACNVDDFSERHETEQEKEVLRRTGLRPGVGMQWRRLTDRA